MALRAGYVGVKRWLYEKLQATAAKNVQDIADIWKANTITGVHNLLYWNKSAEINNEVTFTPTAKKEVTVTWSETTAAQRNYVLVSRNSDNFTLPAGKYILTGCPIGGSEAVSGGYSLMMQATRNGQLHQFGADIGSGLTVDIQAGDVLQFVILIGSGLTGRTLTFKPMLRLASDTDTTFAPCAMTNQQLTGSADEQKTAINAIITAATGAADFAAFKTAMAAISPVTRSAAPDTREASPEVIADDPEPVTKTTKSSTKKTVTTKEGE